MLQYWLDGGALAAFGEADALSAVFGVGVRGGVREVAESDTRLAGLEERIKALQARKQRMEAAKSLDQQHAKITVIGGRPAHVCVVVVPSCGCACPF
jgi:hypothetical protein